MTTLLDKTLKGERLRDRGYISTLSPVTLKLTLKGKRKQRALRGEQASAAMQWGRQH